MFLNKRLTLMCLQTLKRKKKKKKKKVERKRKKRIKGEKKREEKKKTNKRGLFESETFQKASNPFFRPTACLTHSTTATFHPTDAADGRPTTTTTTTSKQLASSSAQPAR